MKYKKLNPTLIPIPTAKPFGNEKCKLYTSVFLEKKVNKALAVVNVVTLRIITNQIFNGLFQPLISTI
jgi:hypothetical protein